VDDANPSLFIIAGPTAAGKSDVAVAVAERCGGEIVSADAFQIYEGLDVLTAKPSPALRQRVPHHLIGEIPLTQSFDVAQYLRLAQECIAAIRDRGRVPIVVGGTGLYLRALTHGLADLPPADPALRAQLELQSTGELVRQLAELDPVAHEQVDLQNRRRVVRALEVCILSERPFSSFRGQWDAPSVKAKGVVLNRPREELYTRINERTEAMFAAGVVEEVRATGAISPTAHQTLGWREINALLAGTMSPAECVGAIQQATRKYAKRQLTWFRREACLEWIEVTGTDIPSNLIDDVMRRAIRAQHEGAGDSATDVGMR
jgi:tRNA dimethylallyltransferase